MVWKWKVTCEKCGFKSRWHNLWVAKLISLWHTFMKHPHGFNTIAAAEKDQMQKWEIT